MRLPTLTAVLAAAGFCAAGPGAFALEPLNVSVSEDVYSADLVIAGGVSARLTVTFEDVVGLNADSLGVSVTSVDPLDYALLQRLAPAASGVPGALPMLVHIEPDPAHGLTFSGIVTVELYTHALEFTAGSPLRLYSAPAGGTFRDITAYNLGGSYRTGGTKGNFSEFIIAIDTRSAVTAAADKLQYLRDLLNGHATGMDAGVHQELSALLSDVESAFAGMSIVTAITRLEEFEAAVRRHSGTIPDVWSASNDLENVAGQLRSAAGTLRYSLTLVSNSP